MMDYLVGIDPGLNGGIVSIDMDGQIIFKWTMPIIDSGKSKREIDLVALRGIFDEVKEAKMVFIEKVGAMPGQGVSSMFKFGKVFGYLEAMIAAFQMPYIMVTPQQWSKEMHFGLSRDLKPKDRSLLVLNRLYPKIDLRATERSKKPHDGLLDALLIAEYGRRKTTQTNKF